MEVLSFSQHLWCSARPHLRILLVGPVLESQPHSAAVDALRGVRLHLAHVLLGTLSALRIVGKDGDRTPPSWPRMAGGQRGANWRPANHAPEMTPRMFKSHPP